MFIIGFKEDELIFDSEKIKLQGSYGEDLTELEIQSIELTTQLPTITSKTNGFALGTINKGYFQTSEGEIIKLILNSDNEPYILFIKRDGEKIYFSAKEGSNEALYIEIKKTLPGLTFRE